MVFSDALVVANGFQRQPLKPRVIGERDTGSLHCGLTVRAVTARGAWRGNQTVRARLGADLQLKRVAAHQPARWMHQYVVADRIAFGIETLQNPQRPAVAVPCQGLASFQPVVKLKSCVPGHAASVLLPWQQAFTRRPMDLPTRALSFAMVRRPLGSS